MKPILYILSLIIIVGCAQQSMLTGGEKDIVGPALIQEKTIPENYSTLFNSNVIQLHFNEYVQLKDQKKNFFVNPPIDNIQLEEKGKSIFIHIDESLRENTTYTFNFGSSIRDITENNPFQDFKYVTSTGNYIDSNFFRGIVYDAFSKESIENIKIFLYEKQLDSLNESILPNYMGYSDNSGNFMLNNLKEGRYYVLAVEDKNGNSKPDPINEKIAFDTSFVIALNPGDTSYKDTLQLFMHNKTLKVIEKKYSPPGKVDVVFNKKLLNSDVKITNRNYYIHQKEFPSDTFSFWIDSIPEAPLSFEITVEKEDFLKELKVNTYESSTKDTVLTFKERNLNNLRPDKPLQLLFNHPIKKINSEKLHFLIDSIDSEKNYSFNDELWSMKIPEIPNTSLEILAEPGAFATPIDTGIPVHCFTFCLISIAFSSGS